MLKVIHIRNAFIFNLIRPMAVIEAGVSTTVDDLFRAVTTISSMSSENTGKINKK